MQHLFDMNGQNIYKATRTDSPVLNFQNSTDLPDKARVQYLEEHLHLFDSGTILDIGCGKDALYSELLAAKGKNVIAADIYDALPNLSSNIKYLPIKKPGMIPLHDCSVNVVWASHVLEHACDLGSFLMEIRRVLVVDGLILVAVPPFKYEIVNHFTTGWSVGQLAYVLAGFGFNCNSIRFLEKGYNVLGGGMKSELLINPTHFGINGVSIKKVINYLPKHIKIRLEDQIAKDIDIVRFEGNIKDTGTVVHE